ncbi:phosphomannomutase [Vreelandella aquamarina]|uniref:phosphomannomutase n=1 Tax=Vreelandella aquamarina TaxID=77097 RepID=UPI000784B978|nr:phosphomannomutase [Halomonas axialensis]
MALTTSQIIANSGVVFGTSGARSMVTHLTTEVCAAFATAFLSVLRQETDISSVAIGMDRRPSSPGMAAACTAAALAMGIEVIDYGVLPTPALALQAMADDMPAIMITGSHIPFDRNGIKFYRAAGEINKVDEQAILSIDAVMPSLSRTLRQSVSGLAAEQYCKRYTQWFEGKPLSGKRIGLYQHSAAGRELNQHIIEALGATVITLAPSDDFVPIDTEAVSNEDCERGQKWAEVHALDSLFSTDGDGDRPLIADEKGNWLRGDIVGLLCARELNIEAVAIPVSCNTAIEASGAFEKVERTRIGSPYVLAAMESLQRKYTSVAGFEANGGFLLGSGLAKDDKKLTALPTRDAVLPALVLMVAAANRQVPLSALAAELPARYTASDRLKNFSSEKSQQLLNVWSSNTELMVEQLGLAAKPKKIELTDGLRVVLDDHSVVHFRASGNAPELRCYVETESLGRTEQLLHTLMQSLTKR